MSEAGALDRESTGSQVAAQRNRPGALVLLCGVQLMLLLDFSIVNVALPSMESSVGLGAVGTQWVVGAYALGFGSLLLLGGRLSDLLGRRLMLVVGVAAFGAASLVGGLATAPEPLIAMRAVQGVGAALIAPAALSLITTGFPDEGERNRALGWFSAASASGFAIGVLLGGVLTELAGWRAVFFVNVPLTAAALLAAFKVLPGAGGARGERAYDLPGVLLSAAGFVALINGLSQVPDDGTHAAVSCSVGVVLLVVFVVVEARSAAPLVPLGIFRSRSLSVANVASFLIPGVMGTTALQLSLFLQQVQGRSALETGFAFLPLGLSVVVAGPLSALSAGRFGPKGVCVVGGALVTAGVFLLSRIEADSGYAADVLPGTILMGMGFAAFFSTAMMAATAGVPERLQGLAGGLLNTFQQVGTAAFVAILVSLATARTESLGDPTPDHQAAGFQTAFTAGAVVALVTTLLVAVALPGHRAVARTEATA
ncbi:MFS transporter [Streptomyces sp. NPDC003247]|uniref:MFS transporter n=1 Tax=Streptomyces sp. NPDC003247 TaxID=3364677 RepID=UPI0036C4ABA5